MARMPALRTDGYPYLPAIIAIAHIAVLGKKILAEIQRCRTRTPP